MHKVLKFTAKNKLFSKYILSEKIIAIEYQENIPIEKDCIKIVFENKAELSIYSFMRLRKNDKLFFCMADGWLNGKTIQNLHILKEKLLNAKIDRIKQNIIGDTILLLDNNMTIEILIDITHIDTDYFRVDKGNNYFVMCRYNNKLINILGREE